MLYCKRGGGGSSLVACTVAIALKHHGATRGSCRERLQWLRESFKLGLCGFVRNSALLVYFPACILCFLDLLWPLCLSLSISGLWPMTLINKAHSWPLAGSIFSFWDRSLESQEMAVPWNPKYSEVDVNQSQLNRLQYPSCSHFSKSHTWTKTHWPGVTYWLWLILVNNQLKQPGNIGQTFKFP